MIAYWIAVAGLCIGLALGLVGLFAPKLAARIVRLQPDPDPKLAGGFAEFRASYGGLFAGGHAAALAVTIPAAFGASQAAPIALGACLTLAAAWGLTAVGRILSMLLDGTRTPYNRASTLFEAVLGGLIAAPLHAAFA